MNMGINLAARELRRALTGDINRSELPHCVVRAELQALLREVEQQEEEQIKAERQAFEAVWAEESRLTTQEPPTPKDAEAAADWMGGEAEETEPDGVSREAGQEAEHGA